MWRIAKIPWRYWRRAGQLVCLGAFVYLFRRTEYDPLAPTPSYVNVLFRVDPLVALAATLAGMKVVVGLVAPALATLALTLVLGRFFCGWVCPLGSLLDLFHRVTRPVSGRLNRVFGGRTTRLAPLRYFLLVLVLLTAALGFPLVGYFDPFALLVRGLTCAVDPALSFGTTWVSAWLYNHASPGVTRVSEPVYAFLQTYVLPSQQARAALLDVSFVILLGVFAAEWVSRRFWCRYVCPLGGLLGLCSRVSLVRRLPAQSCKGCGECKPMCRMDAFTAAGKFSPEACTLCMDCIDDCPHQIAKFTAKRSKLAPAPMQASRRLFLTATATGLAVPLVVKAARIGPTRQPDALLLRPPGTGPEARFLNLCVRCGECLKVCPTNGLQPVLLQAGIEGMFSPHLVPRVGYCEYNCNLCSQVCPTTAIAKLTLEQKQKAVIGRAEFDQKRCLPWAENTPCICCEEHCPISDKAIKTETVTVKDKEGTMVELQRPRVDPELCIGCGICENKCPLEPSAIQVTRVDAPHPEDEHPRRLRRRGGRE